MKHIYPVDPTIYKISLIDIAIREYYEYAREQKFEISYTPGFITVSSLEDDDIIFHEFINYLLSLHVTS